mmetsp:Transcript_25056/g.57124  ORF Transcript_25056/g.57124 Transcript_25056/m.57124 type:complete len:88 (+) Transcript_25056:1627-1890(+)
MGQNGNSSSGNSKCCAGDKGDSDGFCSIGVTTDRVKEQHCFPIIGSINYGYERSHCHLRNIAGRTLFNERLPLLQGPRCKLWPTPLS